MKAEMSSEIGEPYDAIQQLSARCLSLSWPVRDESLSIDFLLHPLRATSDLSSVAQMICT